MKIFMDRVVAEVRVAGKAVCDRFGNDPARLLAHLRAEQRNYRGRIIKDWGAAQPAAVLRETPQAKTESK